MYFQMNYTDFSHRVFALLDTDGSGEIDFREFVIATWNYCTFTHRALAVFAFNLFDLDNSGATVEVDGDNGNKSWPWSRSQQRPKQLRVLLHFFLSRFVLIVHLLQNLKDILQACGSDFFFSGRPVAISKI